MRALCQVLVSPNIRILARLRDGDPPQHLRELPISPRPEQEVPVIRHEAIGRDAYPSPVVGLGQNLLKHGAVGGLVKQRGSTDSAVEHMIGKVSDDLDGFRFPTQE